ncbi:WcaI family glycosyltransferase [Roseicyclus sp. F158]|uniref:WcaI family glycosyltransferase n=1 Tax=Tropicimonas omnivorans TaxID=3075590 RepID=A0ABU3DFI1_9RHOB|nr:WcaI family glycosyltransferase [Roseicyclus sp. F158]MDT0682465.1 WcaI family glycosyltransferase [Roseicyclus sp. F158]
MRDPGSGPVKVLILGLNSQPERTGIAVYTSGLARYLAERGATIRHIAGQPYYPGWAVAEGHSRFLWQRRQAAPGLGVLHCPHYVPPRPNGIVRILHHLSFAASSALPAAWSAIRFRPDIVFTVAPSLASAPVALAAAALAGAPAWLHVQDLEVDAAGATGLMRDGPVLRLARALERAILRRFDRVSTISAPMKRRLAAKGVSETRLTEFRNWADIAAIAPFEGPSPMRQILGLNRPRIALYSGSLSRKQGVELLAGVARALEKRDDLTLLVCGDGPSRAELEELCRGLDNVAFRPLQPPERLSALLGATDVHLLPQMGSAADLVLPSKLTNMLASARPVVATAAPGTALAEEVAGCGIVTPPGDAAAMAHAVGRLLDDEPLRLSLGRAARARALSRWDGSAILARAAAEMEALARASDTARASVPLDAERGG